MDTRTSSDTTTGVRIGLERHEHRIGDKTHVSILMHLHPLPKTVLLPMLAQIDEANHRVGEELAEKWHHPLPPGCESFFSIEWQKQGVMVHFLEQHFYKAAHVCCPPVSGLTFDHLKRVLSVYKAHEHLVGPVMNHLMHELRTIYEHEVVPVHQTPKPPSSFLGGPPPPLSF